MSKLDVVWLQEYHCLLYCRGRLLVGTAFAFMTHMIVTYSQNNKAFNHVIAASSSSWLQEHVADMSERYVTCWYCGAFKLQHSNALYNYEILNLTEQNYDLITHSFGDWNRNQSNAKVWAQVQFKLCENFHIILCKPILSHFQCRSRSITV